MPSPSCFFGDPACCMNDQHPDISATARASEEKNKCRQKLWPEHGEADLEALPRRGLRSVAHFFLHTPALPVGLHVLMGSSTPKTSRPLSHQHQQPMAGGEHSPMDSLSPAGSSKVAVTVPAWGSRGVSATEPRCRRNVGSTDGPLSINRREDFLFTCVGSAQITHRGPELQAGKGRNSLQMKGC